MSASENRAVTEVDREIGDRIRARRQELQLPQTHVAEMLGISFQQFQKYEAGDNRVSAATLTRIAHVLRVEPAELLPGSDKGGRKKRGAVGDAMAMQLQDAFSRLSSPRDRRMILEMTRRLTGEAEVEKTPVKAKKKARR